MNSLKLLAVVCTLFLAVSPVSGKPLSDKDQKLVIKFLKMRTTRPIQFRLSTGHRYKIAWKASHKTSYFKDLPGSFHQNMNETDRKNVINKLETLEDAIEGSYNILPLGARGSNRWVKIERMEDNTFRIHVPVL